MTNAPQRILSLFAFLAAALADALGSADDWPRYGHDAALTGRSPLVGKISAPRVAWTFPLAGRELLVELAPSAGEHALRLSAEAAAESGSRPIGPAGLRQLDPDGTGTLRPAQESFHERWVKILPGVPGLQRVAWNHTWTDQKVCRLQLFAYEKGIDHPRLVWETDPPEGLIFQPLNVVFDIDGDGVQEICVAAHYRVMIFEGTTGRKETELRYHSSRPYGWFGLADVDADGQVELVTLGDFQSHIDVLKFDPKQPEPQRLGVLWRRDIEQNIERREKWPQIGPCPVADVSGDGRLEIVVNLFNDTGDGQWHAVVLDAATGRAIADFPRRFVQGVADANGDRRAEVFLASTEGVVVQKSGRIELVAMPGPAPAVLWWRENAGWCCADWNQLGSTWSTTASQGMRHVLLSGDGPPAFLVASTSEADSPQLSLSAMRIGADPKVESLWEVAGFPRQTEPVSLEPGGDQGQVVAMVRTRLAPGMAAELAGRNARSAVRENRATAIGVSMPIAARLRTGEGVAVVVEAAGEQIAVIDPPRNDAKTPSLRWQRPG
ncbi:MAG: VCBS repeat-containing protein, partial [Pirellulales bacterium]|nr:VCBS repeat-containing protein [Pirellulales bacterium]